MNPSKPEIDATDRRILNALQREGRLTNADLADRINLSASACHRRVKRLEDAGVIRDYAARLDPRAVGRGATVFVEVTLTSQSEEILDGFERAIAKVPDVLECHLMAGTADYLVKVAARDSDDYARIHRQHLTRLPGVAQMHSSFALRTVFGTTALPLD